MQFFGLRAAQAMEALRVFRAKEIVMSRKTVNLGLVGLALAVSLAAVPTAEAGSFSKGARPSGFWSQAWSWAVSIGSGNGAAAVPGLVTSVWAKVGWHIDPNGGVGAFDDGSTPVDPANPTPRTVDRGSR